MHVVVMEQARYRWEGRARPRPPSARMSDAPRAGDAAGFAAQIAAIAERADRDAFASLFNHFAPRVKRYALRLGATPELADDLAQETLLTVWRKAGSFDASRAAASTWIFTIARNLRIDVARRDRQVADFMDLPDTPDAEPTPDAVLAAAQSETQVRHALLSLPVEQAEVVRLSYFSEKPHAEIASDLGLPLGTVKSRMRLAMDRLRNLLGELA
jgi:RNA polymerase sigma-70 factor (ECF subfamily)